MGFYTGTIQHGSNNQDTKRWQEFLRSQGYDLEVDGIFGDITKGYTIDYQSKNGLTADGIVGEQTWGKAGFSNANTPISAPTITSAPTALTLGYTKWNDTTAGQAAYENKENAYNAMVGHGDHVWANQDWYKQVLQGIKDRPDFSYDFNQDALYQQYKDKYTKQAKMAMADTMGQAAALTGGYGSSYASTAGNQAYQASLENLNDVIPELYQMAYDRYNQKGQDLYNQASLLMNDYNRSYGEHQDKYNKLVNEYGIASDDYYSGANLHNTEQNAKNSVTQQNWQNEFNTWEANNTNAWKKATWDEDARRWLIENDREEDQWNWQKKNTNVTTGGDSTDDDSTDDDSTDDDDDDDDDEPIVSPGDSQSVKTFMNSLSPESAHDAIARQMYGTYNGYIATMLSKDKTLTADEKAWIMSYYGITETDLDYSENALANGKRTEDSPKTTVKPYAERTWTEVDDGGINWFWGVDEDAVYKDNYGTEFTGEELVKLLVKEGMSEKKAKEYVKKLQ